MWSVMQNTIRRGAPEDVDAILEIEQATSTAAHWSRSQYSAVFDFGGIPRLCLVAECGKVCGFLVAQTAETEWELENIAVAPMARRQGVGAELLRGLLKEAQCQGARQIRLEVRASNAAARALYEGCGFAQAGTRPRYYQNPQEDAILYRRILAGSLGTP